MLFLVIYEGTCNHAPYTNTLPVNAAIICKAGPLSSSPSYYCGWDFYDNNKQHNDFNLIVSFINLEGLNGINLENCKLIPIEIIQ